ncbi:hypothetical protein FB567DRAFT_218586 [Paraphoma chrysanthemicola]|uniref:Uncharacterized protein n=1 Tax=Paraphoma chrysanthemicola TaxID=798071 RepID=A0A8K0QT88_9PLEO|nr:hypothetical protein FB567DRAFT_218586 [Paraphoma chrysanthemicola]
MTPYPPCARPLFARFRSALAVAWGVHGHEGQAWWTPRLNVVYSRLLRQSIPSSSASEFGVATCTPLDSRTVLPLPCSSRCDRYTSATAAKASCATNHLCRMRRDYLFHELYSENHRLTRSTTLYFLILVYVCLCRWRRIRGAWTLVTSQNFTGPRVRKKTLATAPRISGTLQPRKQMSATSIIVIVRRSDSQQFQMLQRASSVQSQAVRPYAEIHGPSREVSRATHNEAFAGEHSVCPFPRTAICKASIVPQLSRTPSECDMA